MNKKLSVFFAAMCMSFVAMASTCDDSVITIIGPKHYQYLITLTEGTFIGKNNHKTRVALQSANPNGERYHVFSGTGTWGKIGGDIYFVDPDTKENISFVFRLTTPHGCLARVTKQGTSEKFTILTPPLTSYLDKNLRFEIRELKK